MATLKRNDIASGDFCSQSWDEFDGKDIDIAITVCDQAAGEVCPVYLNSIVRAHWGLPDPAHGTGTGEEIMRAFQDTYDALRVRINEMLALPVETMSKTELIEALNKIGAESH